MATTAATGRYQGKGSRQAETMAGSRGGNLNTNSSHYQDGGGGGDGERASSEWKQLKK